MHNFFQANIYKKERKKAFYKIFFPRINGNNLGYECWYGGSI